MNKKLLLSHEEYCNLPQIILDKVPYAFSLQNNRQVFCYFGCNHTNDINHPQFNLLHDEWLIFLKTLHSKKTIVFYEGNVNEKHMSTWEESIKNFGESGAVVFLANKANIPIYRPEPTIEYESTELLKEYSKDELYCFYMIRGIVSWQRKTERTDFGYFIERNIKRYKDALMWKEFDFSFENITKIYKKIFNKDFTLDDKEFLRRAVAATYYVSSLNEISRQSIKIRDFFILENIGKYWKEGYNIFIVYGSLHAKMQERAIREMTEG